MAHSQQHWHPLRTFVDNHLLTSADEYTLELFRRDIEAQATHDQLQAFRAIPIEEFRVTYRHLEDDAINVVRNRPNADGLNSDAPPSGDDWRKLSVLILREKEDDDWWLHPDAIGSLPHEFSALVRFTADQNLPAISSRSRK